MFLTSGVIPSQFRFEQQKQDYLFIKTKNKKMKNKLQQVAIRNNAIYIPNERINKASTPMNETTTTLMGNLMQMGYTFSEGLLHAVNGLTPAEKMNIFEVLKEVTGINKNWTPLVKQWDQPTGEGLGDHVKTFFANLFNTNKGTTLSCGHIIPNNTFPLERYNGCPYCGTPFEFEKLELSDKPSKLRILILMRESDLEKYFHGLLQSPVALDATQVDSLKILLNHFGLPKNINVGIKETMMLLVDVLIDLGEDEKAGSLFKTPNDILRYLWYKHTGFLQIIAPKVILNRMTKNAQHLHPYFDKSVSTLNSTKADLKLKYSRTDSIRYAKWINNLNLDVESLCENMHPKRSMWVRYIRALRLAEYSKRKGFEKLAKLLDAFYNEQYNVLEGRVNYYKLKSDANKTFGLLKQRPGLFARSLFSNMLWFGPEITLKHFKEVLNEVPPRLIYTLNMYADIYFDKNAKRSVKPLGGVNKKIPTNKMLALYNEKSIANMKAQIQELTLDAIKQKFANEKNVNKTIFIEEGLLNVPIAIGDRSETVQDLEGALMGTRFKVSGDSVRLFMQWGEGLPAQHLDMDLSCSVAYGRHTDFCSYSRLIIPGCKHSGDIQSIPNMIGTAEYIELNLPELERSGAQYVSFTCNAYTHGSIAPNLVVGWMNSHYPMKISNRGVAYNPSDVQHQVRIRESMTKGLLFGMLDIAHREIVWLEMPFGGQVVQNLSFDNAKALLQKLDAKLKIGDLLKLKAAIQNLEVTQDKEKADEVYDMQWALNTAKVSQLFLD